MIDYMVSTSDDGARATWKRRRLHELDLHENALETILFENEQLLSLDRFGLIVDRIKLYQQLGAVDVMGDSKYPDLVFLTDRGDFGIVEVKRFGNPELRGRKVISQVLDYGATLSSLSEQQLLALFADGADPPESFEELAAAVFSGSPHIRSIAANLRNRTRNAQLHYIVACDEAPVGLTDWVRAASRNDATDYQIGVLEVSPFSCESRKGELIWIAQPILRTETIHRTSVRVERDDESGQIHVHVSSDAPESVEDRISDEGPRETRNVRDAQEALEQLQKCLPVGNMDLWAVLRNLHDKALREDWGWVYSTLGSLDAKPEAYLRGNAPPGLVEGRFGVNLIRPSRPGFFVGAYFSGHDHQVEPLGLEEGGDFAVILDVQHSWGEEIDFWESEEFGELVDRLEQHPGEWLFSRSSNPWHPVLLHRRLADLLAGAKSETDVEGAWFRAAREGISLLLEGGELQRLVNRVSGERQAS